MLTARPKPVAALMLLGTAILGAPMAASAQAAHEALVIGNGTYTNLPPLPGCLPSAHAVAAALRTAGYNVIEREDASNGGTDAAVGEFAKRLSASPGAAAIVYVCAYTLNFSDRPFLLPATAALARPADVLTQGVLAKSLIDTVGRNNAGAALLALDVVAAPNSEPGSGLGAKLWASLPDASAGIAVSQSRSPDAMTPLAAALTEQLKAASLTATAASNALGEAMSASKSVSLVGARPPGTIGYLIGAPPPPPVASPPAASAPAATPPSAAVATMSPAPPPVSAVPKLSLPADDELSDAERRRMQSALTRLGYYAGQVDGIFGPDTRAAIRRYQHELGAAMTGKLTSEQSTRLAGGG